MCFRVLRISWLYRDDTGGRPDLSDPVNLSTYKIDWWGKRTEHDDRVDTASTGAEAPTRLNCEYLYVTRA
jgi:hypothetical protein